MEVRHTKIDELEEVLGIYSRARTFMSRMGNPNQWNDDWPPEELIKSDIENNNSYVCVKNNQICGVFAYLSGPDPTYKIIEDGAWPNDEEYGVIHRIASSLKESGIVRTAVNFALSKCANLRIDTHKDNKPMRRALSQEGLKYCGIIYAYPNSPRMAFHKKLHPKQKAINSIISFCSNGEKPETCGKYGVEVEHIILNNKGKSVLLDMQGKPTIHSIMENLRQFYDKAIIETDNDNVKYIKKLIRDDAEVTFEPGGQIEVALSPQKSIITIKTTYEKFLSELSKVCQEFNYHVEHIGYRPDLCALEVPIIQANRYLCMDARFRNSDTHGVCMMRNSASLQVSIDYHSEKDCGQKLKVATCLSPIFYFLFDNSPIFEKIIIGSDYTNSGLVCPKRMARYKIWDNTDNDRTGAIHSAFDGFSYEKYAKQALKTPLIYARNTQENLISDSKTMPIGKDRHLGSHSTEDIISDVELTLDEIQHILSMGFYDARLKNFIELRAADCVPPKYLYSYIALIKGLFNRSESFSQIYKLFENTTEMEYLEAGKELYDKGWDAYIYNYKVKDLTNRIIELARNGLDKKESVYLQPLNWLIKNNYTVLDTNDIQYDNDDEFMPISNTSQNTQNQLEYYNQTRGDLQGRKVSYIAQLGSKAIYANKIVRQGYFSKIYGTSERLIMQDLVSTTYKIFKKIIDRYYSDPEYARLFSFNDFEQRLINFRPKYDACLPIGRIDIFFDDITGNFEFCEFNAAGSAAMNEVYHVCRNARKSGCFKFGEHSLSKKGKTIKEYELFTSWCKQFVKIYNQWSKNTHKNPALPNGKTQFGIIDFLDNCAINDLYHFEKTFNARGYKTKVIDIHDLIFDGKVLSTTNGYRIDGFYKRVTMDDLFRRKSESGVKAMIEAVESEAVCPIDWFSTQIIHDKQICSLLFHPKTQSFLSPAEIRFIKLHQPETHILNNTIINNPYYLINKNDYICKPISSRGAQGIFPGQDYCKSEWKKILNKYATGDKYIIQKYACQKTTPNVCINPYNKHQSLEPDYKKTIKQYSNMEGLYCYNGKFAGVYLRQGQGSINSRNLNNIDCATFYED